MHATHAIVSPLDLISPFPFFQMESEYDGIVKRSPQASGVGRGSIYYALIVEFRTTALSLINIYTLRKLVKYNGPSKGFLDQFCSLLAVL